MSEKIQNLCKLMKEFNVSSYIIPSTDEFFNEYTPEHKNRLKYITNFSGSNGIAVINDDGNHMFFTDGRYGLQAQNELPASFEICDLASYPHYLCSKRNAFIGFDPHLHTHTSILNIKKHLDRPENLKALPINLVDKIWENRTTPVNNAAFIHDIKYSGKDASDKLSDVFHYISENKVDCLIISDPSSVCWLLNIRGNDVPLTPFVLCKLMAYSNACAVLYTDTPINTEVEQYLASKNVIVSTDQNLKIENLSGRNVEVGLIASYYLVESLKDVGAKYTQKANPCLMPKACKNKVEITGAQNAHKKDGMAVKNFFKWLESNIDKGFTEHELAMKLLDFRKEQKDFVSPSFDSIVGFKENGAIVHYKPPIDSSKKVIGSGLLLIDSGGQYRDGTTDITRVIPIGKPSKEQIHNYTLVLKGHIRLASAIFPEGTSGSQLDAFARLDLWKEGLDYSHGTGHGVGSFLSVHEGPQNIGRGHNATPLMPGMIVSIEPGFYKTGEYGIRIESLAYVVESEHNGFLKFEILTQVPIDTKLVDFSILTEDEKSWLTDYNNRCI